jgi:hypothetical protein
MCDAMTLLHAQPTHSPELPRSVGCDVNDVTSGGHYGWISLTFWMFIIQRWLGLSREFILKQFMSTEKEENTPIAMNTNSFPRDSQFPWCLSCCFWYTIAIDIVLQDKMWPANIWATRPILFFIIICELIFNCDFLIICPFNFRTRAPGWLAHPVCTIARYYARRPTNHAYYTSSFNQCIGIWFIIACPSHSFMHLDSKQIKPYKMCYFGCLCFKPLTSTFLWHVVSHIEMKNVQTMSPKSKTLTDAMFTCLRLYGKSRIENEEWKG